jgi:hypothetical protein
VLGIGDIDIPRSEAVSTTLFLPLDSQAGRDDLVVCAGGGERRGGRLGCDFDPGVYIIAE